MVVHCQNDQGIFGIYQPRSEIGILSRGATSIKADHLGQARTPCVADLQMTGKGRFAAIVNDMTAGYQEVALHQWVTEIIWTTTSAVL